MSDEFHTFLDEELKDPVVRHAYLHSKAMTKRMLREEFERLWQKLESARPDGEE